MGAFCEIFWPADFDRKFVLFALFLSQTFLMVDIMRHILVLIYYIYWFTLLPNSCFCYNYVLEKLHTVQFRFPMFCSEMITITQD